MTIKPLIKAIAALAVGGMMLSASANSVGFDQNEYISGPDVTVTITLNYDFADFAMFGGGIDIVWDTNAISFGTYTQAELQDDAQSLASPLGQFTVPGVYTGAGVGTFDFFNGMTSSGAIGTFVFNVLDGAPGGNTPCGMTICVVPNAINPLVSLVGDEVTALLLDSGISGANVSNIPVPAAVWFMLSGLGALLGFGRKKA